MIYSPESLKTGFFSIPLLFAHDYFSFFYLVCTTISLDMGNTISLFLSILQVGGCILSFKWACSLHLPTDHNKSIISLMSELRRVFYITGGFFISLCIPFSLNIFFMLHSHSVSFEKIGFGFSILGLSFYNLSCYNLSYDGISLDALLLSGLIGLSGARAVIHHGYRLWIQDKLIVLQVHSNPNTILTEPGNTDFS